MRVKGVVSGCACNTSAFQAVSVLLAPKKNPQNAKIGQNRLYFGYQNIHFGKIIC